MTLEDELDESIKLFFWHPKKGRDKYIQQYRLHNQPQITRDNNGIRYPRLLLLREDLYFVLWKNSHSNKRYRNGSIPKAFNSLPHFASILIMRSALEMLVRALFSVNFDCPKSSEYKTFFENYLDIDKQSAYALYLLRNSLVHDGYSLRYRDEPKNLLYDFEFSENISDPIIKKSTSEKGRLVYIVNSWLLHERFETALDRLKSKLLEEENISLRGRYKEYLSSRDRWILVK